MADTSARANIGAAPHLDSPFLFQPVPLSQRCNAGRDVSLWIAPQLPRPLRMPCRLMRAHDRGGVLAEARELCRDAERAWPITSGGGITQFVEFALHRRTKAETTDNVQSEAERQFRAPTYSCDQYFRWTAAFVPLSSARARV